MSSAVLGIEPICSEGIANLSMYNLIKALQANSIKNMFKTVIERISINLDD